MVRGHGFIHMQHRAGRQANRQHAPREVMAIFRGKALFQDFRQRIAIDHARAIGGEALILCDIRDAQKFAEFPKGRVIAGGDENLAGFGFEFGIGHQIRVRITRGLGALVGQEVIRRMGMQQRHAAIMQRHVAILPLAGFFPLMQRHQNGDGGKQPRRNIHNWRAEPRRPGSLRTIDRHQPDHCLQHRIIAGEATQRPFTAKAGYAAMDQAREAF